MTPTLPSELVPRRFPDTRDSLVQALASNATHSQAFDLIVRAYRTPVIALLERRWNLEHADAEDLAHEFFSTALEKEWFSRYSIERGRFRTFLRVCLFTFASTDHERRQRQKRGGAAQHASLDERIHQLEADNTMDALFEQEWIRSVLQIALDALRAEASGTVHEIATVLFERYDVLGSEADTRPTYAQLATQFSLPVTQVTNHLAWARKNFRQHVLNTLRALTATEQEYRAEVRTLLGVNLP